MSQYLWIGRAALIYPDTSGGILILFYILHMGTFCGGLWAAREETGLGRAFVINFRCRLALLID
jgi:hypothetical protein